MSRQLLILLGLAAAAAAAGCGERAAPENEAGRKVETTGKQETALEAVPDEVLQVARRARPDLAVGEAEFEVRDGREYYDVGGTLPDGSELELDMTRVDGKWTVVEIQRDVGLDEVPGAVRDALAGHSPGWVPERIIESDQGDGVIIFEFFGQGRGGETVKTEVKFEGAVAEVLTDEWQH